MQRLAALRPDAPVLSLYLDLDPAEVPTPRARKSASTALLDAAHKRVEGYTTDHARKESLRSDLEHAEAFFQEWTPKGARSVAVFSATLAGFFENVPLPRPTHTWAFVDDSPYVTPLVTAADLRDWLIVVVDAQHARMLHGNTEHIEEFERVTDTVAGRHEASGPTDHQRWVEHQVDQHLGRVAKEVDALAREARFERIIVAAPREIAPRFESKLSAATRERIAGHLRVEIGGATPDEIRHAALPCFEAEERRHEREVLDRLVARLAKSTLAAAGVDAVRDMLVQRRVEVLLLDERWWRYEDPAAIESAVEDAIAQSAEILPIRHYPDELALRGRIAAVLRF
jgi:hypothetical protein